MKKYGLSGSRVFISLLLVLVLFLSLLISACKTTTSTSTTQTSTTTTQTSSTTKTSTTTTQTTAAQKVLKFGAVLNMSSPRGIQDKKWYDLFAKMYNDAGGWKIGNDTYKLQIITYDSQGNMTTGKDLLTRLVLQDGCKFIIGQTSSGSAAVDTTITEPNKVIAIHEDLASEGTVPANQYFYSVGSYFGNATNYIIAKVMAAKGVKTYVGVRPDNQVGRFMEPTLNAAWQMGAPNVAHVGTIWVDPGTIDWAPIATKIKSTNADVADLMFLGFIPNSIPQTYRALYDVGYKGTILPGFVTQADLDALVVQVGKAAVEGGLCSNMGLDPRLAQKDPRMLSILNAYASAYGNLETDAIQDTLGFFSLEAAINATQSVDVDVIKNYLDNSPPPIRSFLGWNEFFARPDQGNYRTICASVSGPAGDIRSGKLIPGPLMTIKDGYLFQILSAGQVDVYKAYWAKYGYPQFPAEEKGLEYVHYTDLGITGQD